MTLYRKYRPQSFADFVNQKSIKLTIQNQIAAQDMPHGYLFSGPRGVGKTTMARLIAKAVNCEKHKEGVFEPCRLCRSCTEIAKGISLDVEEKDAASHGGIDEIRVLKDTVRFAPSHGRYKIIIIDEAHMLTTPAFNALLKTLEEPPLHILFVLATTEPHKLPETIISRCQRFDFKKVSENDIATHLRAVAKKEGVEIDEEIIISIASRSEGGVRDALSMLGQVIVAGGGAKKITWEEAGLVLPRGNSELRDKFIQTIEDGDARAAFEIINAALDEGADREQFMISIIQGFREKLFSVIDNQVSMSRYGKFLDIWLARFEDIQRFSVAPSLPFELGVIDCLGDKMDAPKELVPNTKTPDPFPVSASAHSIVNFDLIKEKWDAVVNAVRGHNHSLPVALSSCKPLRLEGDRLILGFKFKLHYNVIRDDKNRRSLENALNAIFQEKILVRGEVVEDFGETVMLPVQSNVNALVEEVKEMFGDG